MSTLKTTQLQHPDAASPNIVLAADGTVAGLRSTQNTQTGVTYTLALTDIGSLSTFDNASPITVTLPEQATVEWPASSSTSLLTLGAGTVTLSWPAGVTVNGLASGDTSLTLATSKGGSLVRTASNTWTFIPFSAGVEAANFTNTATGTYTSGGINYKFLTLTGSGSVTIDRAGFADVLIVGGGGGGGWRGGGGAGQTLFITQYLLSGTLTVIVGAGGSGTAADSGDIGAQGTLSSIENGPYLALSFGGGGGGGSNLRGMPGASGGGGAVNASIASASSYPGGVGSPPAGLSGGNPQNTGVGQTNGGGGGGFTAVGANSASATAGGNGGAGIANLITNTSIGYSGGGGGGGSSSSGGAVDGGGIGGASASANRGGGGGGGAAGVASGNGGSGVVIIRVVV